MKENDKKTIMPTIATRGLVAFPKMVMHFDIAREKSIKAIEQALATDRKIFLAAQKEIMIEDPSTDDIYNVGVVAEIRQSLKTPDGVVKVLIEGVYKAKALSYDTSGEYIKAEIKKLTNFKRVKEKQLNEIEATEHMVKDAFEHYTSLVPRMPDELVSVILGETNPHILVENIVCNVSFDFKDKQEILEEDDIVEKLKHIYECLTKEIDILSLELEIQEKVKQGIDSNQKEFYLREQMKVISDELEEMGLEAENPENSVVAKYIEQIQGIKNISEESREKLRNEALRLVKTPPSSPEAMVIRDYLENCLALPWDSTSKIKVNIKKAEDVLNKEHYGLEKVKERILESISVHALNPNITGQIICLVGPPGIGKTSIGRSIAKALGRAYTRISLGGVRDESDIRGHRKTYIGAMPGRIINALKQAGTNNPLILLDEIDKMSNDFRGDPSSAMLEVLDSEQNKEFRDHYIEIPFDLSKVLFITTANTTSTIPAPLLDRMEIIELTSYTREEKFHIAKEHLIPKQIKQNGLKPTQVQIDDDAIYSMIDFYTKEAGVRTLERTCGKLCRKTAKAIVEKTSKKLTFTENNLKEYLGIKKFLPEEVSDRNEIGVVNGLAWTSVGGVIMPLEVIVLNGKGVVETTGSLGDVMKESAKIAVSYTRSVAKQYGIDENFYKEKDIHIHAPEGAVPKDGPSAGVTMTTAIISALSGIPVRCDVAMTGEITLHGKVLPIGGLREKTMAAYKAGMKTVIIPVANKPDLEEVDETVKQNIKFVFAETLTDVLDTALVTEKNDKINAMAVG